MIAIPSAKKNEQGFSHYAFLNNPCPIPSIYEDLIKARGQRYLNLVMIMFYSEHFKCSVERYFFFGKEFYTLQNFLTLCPRLESRCTIETGGQKRFDSCT